MVWVLSLKYQGTLDVVTKKNQYRCRRVGRVIQPLLTLPPSLPPFSQPSTTQQSQMQHHTFQLERDLRTDGPTDRRKDGQRILKRCVAFSVPFK